MAAEITAICEPFRVNLDPKSGARLGLLNSDFVQAADPDFAWVRDRRFHVSIYDDGSRFLALRDRVPAELEAFGLDISSVLSCLTRFPLGQCYLSLFTLNNPNPNIINLVDGALVAGLFVELQMKFAKSHCFSMADSILYFGGVELCSLVRQRQ